VLSAASWPSLLPCLCRFAYTSYRPYTTLFRKLQQEHASGVHGQEEGQQQEQQQEEQPAADVQQAEQGMQAAVEVQPAGAADSGGSGAGSTTNTSSSNSSSSSSSSSRKLRGSAAAAEPLSLPATVPDLDPLGDDAFGTIMAWLHSRIEATR
jgi:hypothetical protein